MDNAVQTQASTKTRSRLSIDLTAYPDVARMLSRAEKDRFITKTRLVISCLRRELSRQGYARKKDSQSTD